MKAVSILEEAHENGRHDYLHFLHLIGRGFAHLLSGRHHTLSRQTRIMSDMDVLSADCRTAMVGQRAEGTPQSAIPYHHLFDHAPTISVRMKNT